MLNKIRKIKSRYILPLLLLTVLGSCDTNRVFDEYTAIPDGVWSKENTPNFSFAIQDTIDKHHLFINIRNNHNYEFSNLFLITKLSFPDGHKIIDTLEYDMADPTGRFLGTGFTDIKESKLFYKEKITFPIRGEYAINISQAMRKSNDIEGIENLTGITDVGFRIEKIE